MNARFMDTIKRPNPAFTKSGAASLLFLALVRRASSFDITNQQLVPWFANCFNRRPNRSIVSELNASPSRDFEKSVISTTAGCFGVNNCPMLQKENAAVIIFYQLQRSASPAEATHLDNVGHVKQIRCLGGGRFRAFDGADQRFTVDRLGEYFGVGHFQSL